MYKTNINAEELPPSVCSLLWISEWGPVTCTSLPIYIHTIHIYIHTYVCTCMHHLKSLFHPWFTYRTTCSLTIMITHSSLLFVLSLLTKCLAHGNNMYMLNEWMNEWEKTHTLNNNFIAVLWLKLSTPEGRPAWKQWLLFLCLHLTLTGVVTPSLS